MAITACSNYSSPAQFSWSTDDGDRFDRDHVYALARAVDAHTHRSTKGLGVGRITTEALAAACDIAILTDTLTWKNAANNATFEAMSLSGVQTVTGNKTFSGSNTHSGTLAMSGVATFTASPIIDSSYRIILGSGGTNTDVGIQRTATRTITVAAGPNVDTTGVVVNIGTTSTDSALNVFGTIKTPSTLRLGVAGTTADIGISKTSANTVTIDSIPTTGTANTINFGTSGTSNEVRVYGRFLASAMIRAESNAGPHSGSSGEGVEMFADGTWSGIRAYNRTAGAFSKAAMAGSTLGFFPNNSEAWNMNTSGHFIAATGNTYDIGTSSGNSPRYLYAGANNTRFPLVTAQDDGGASAGMAATTWTAVTTCEVSLATGVWLVIGSARLVNGGSSADMQLAIYNDGVSDRAVASAHSANEYKVVPIFSVLTVSGGPKTIALYAYSTQAGGSVDYGRLTAVQVG